MEIAAGSRALHSFPAVLARRWERQESGIPAPSSPEPPTSPSQQLSLCVRARGSGGD